MKAPWYTERQAAEGGLQTRFPFTPRASAQTLTLALCAFYLFLASRIPYTHDDWDWGLPIGLEQLLRASVNSRYAGNACVVLLTRSPLLKTLVMGLGFTLLPPAECRLVSRLGGEDARTLPLLLAANLLFLLMPPAIWRQSCGWVSGFCNFMLSGLLLLACHSLLFRPAPDARPAAPLLGGLFVFGVGMQLFLENVAIYSLGVSLGLLLLRRVWDKKWDFRLLALLLGNALGLGILFSSSVFVTLFRDGQAIEATRELVPNDHVGLLPYLLRCLLYYIKYFPALWPENTWLSCGLLALLALLADRRRRPVFALVNGAFGLWILYRAFFGELPLGSAKRSLYLAIVLSALYFCAVALECLLLFRNRPRFCARLLFYWASAPLVLLPLAITTMEGGRLFFTPYLLESVFALLLLAELLRARPPRRGGVLALALGALLLAVCLRLGAAYGEIGEAYRERLALLTEPAGTVTLPALPHEELLWFADPESQTRLGYFRAFYGVSDALSLTFASGLPYYPW